MNSCNKFFFVERILMDICNVFLCQIFTTLQPKKKGACNLFKEFFEKNSKLPHFEETKVEFAIFKP
jgi:hypothetical protein